MERADDPVLLALLGSSTRLVDDVPARALPRAVGFVETPRRDRLGSSGTRSPVLLRSDLRIESLDAEPAMLVMAEQDIVAVLAGDLVAHDDLVAVDTAHQRVILEMIGGHLLVAEHGAVRVYLLPASEGADYPDPSVPEAAVPAPPVELWSTDQEPWLQDVSRRLASSPRPFERVAAAGVLARLAIHPDPAGSPTVAAVRVWVADVPAASWTVVERDAVGEAILLVELLDDGDLFAPAALPDLFLRRDALAGVALVLRFAGHTTHLAAALTAVDHAAALSMTTLGELAADAGEWLPDYRGAVSWQEPEAWWTLC